MWPIIANQCSVVAIGGRNKAKPLHGRIGGYLLPLVNEILTGQDYAARSDPPLAIILCPNWETAQDVSEQCATLAETITVANDGKPFRIGCIFANELKHAAELSNGCHVLVTTPISLKRMLDPAMNITAMDRCCHLVIEKASESIPKYHSEIENITLTFLRFRHKFSHQPSQIIVSSDEWSEAIRQYSQAFLMRKEKIGPYFVIANPLEALVYSRLKFKAHICESKADILEKMLRSVTPNQVSVVFCKNAQSVQSVQDLLQKKYLETLAITEEMNMFDVKESIRYWLESDTKIVLILSDQCTLETTLRLKHSDVMIHYDYPDSKLQFASRFLHLTKCVTSIYDDEKCDVFEDCHLLLDVQDERQFKTLTDLLKRCKSQIPPQMFQLCELYSNKHRIKLDKQPLCDEVKIFGQCEKMKCKERHFLTPARDTKSFLPDGGIIEFTKPRVIRANHFLVLIKKIYNEEQEILFDFLKVDLKLLKLNARVEFEAANDVSIGEIYCFKDKDSCAKRVQVLKRKEQKVTVLFIDEGKDQELYIDQLFTLPDEYSEHFLPRKANEIVLINVRPKDLQSQWPHEANELMRQSLAKNPQNETICRSKFILELNNTFWVRNFQVLQKAHNSWSPVAELKEELKMFAEDNFQQSVYLKKLCQDSKIEPARYKTLRQFVQLWTGDSSDRLSTSTCQIAKHTKYPIFKKYRTAFFDQDELAIEVYVTEIFNPDCFYVQLTKFQPQRSALETRLKKEFENFVDKGFEPIDEQICISNCNEGKCCRVQYLEETQELFLVDHGWYTDYTPSNHKLVPISKATLETLPFQAIRCSLAQVQPQSQGNWTEETIEYFSQYLEQILWVQNPTKVEDGHYKVDLTLPSTFEPVATLLAKAGHCELLCEFPDISKFESSSAAQIDTLVETKNHSMEEKINGDGDSSKFEFDQSLVLGLAKSEILPAIDKPNVPCKSNESDNKTLELELKKIQEQVEKLQTEVEALPSDGEDESLEELIPSLAVTPDLISQERLPHIVSWSQTLSSLIFTFQFHGMTIKASKLYIKVDLNLLQFHYLHQCQQKEFFDLFKIPDLVLYSHVVPQETEVKVKPTYVEVIMKKVHQLNWLKPCFDPQTQKGVSYPWLKHSVIIESSENEESIESHENANIYTSKSATVKNFDATSDEDVEESSEAEDMSS